MSNPTCGTNLSFGLLQPALVRSATNFLGAPTMCGADFDAYFATVAPRNPYRQVVFTTSALSGAGGTSLGPITIQMQDTSSGATKPLTFTSDTTIDLRTTSSQAFFTLAKNGDNQISSVTIPAGESSATFYYNDADQGTPQITADPGTMAPGVQDEVITSDVPGPEQVSGTAQHAGSNKINGRIEIRGQLTLPDTRIQLQRATLGFGKLLSEDRGLGELVRKSDGKPLDLPVVLAAVRGSQAQNAAYSTPSGVLPRVQVKIKALKGKNAGRAKFQILFTGAEITGPGECSGNPPSTVLHTRMIANDGMHTSAAFDANLNWRCLREGKLNTAPKGAK